MEDEDQVDTPVTGEQSESVGDDQGALTASSDEAGSVVTPSSQPSSTRTSRVWIGTVFGLVVLIAILVFILQNLTSVAVHLPGATVRMPVGVAILFGVILGGLLVFLLGLARVLQLRHGLRHPRPAA